METTLICKTVNGQEQYISIGGVQTRFETELENSSRTFQFISMWSFGCITTYSVFFLFPGCMLCIIV